MANTGIGTFGSVSIMSSTSTSTSMAIIATTAASSSGPQQLENLIPYLPFDISLNILTRLPPSHHPYLSLVSKSFRYVFSSPLIYTTRSLLHFSKPFLYLSIRLPSTRSLHWFTLCQNSPLPFKPPNFLLPLPSTPFSLIGSAIVALGPKIYVIGGCLKDIPSPRVWVLDCRFHTWELISNMNLSREFAAAGVVDGKIYVIGGCLVDTFARSKFWAEVFDPKTQKWESVDSAQDYELREKWMHASAVVGDKIYAMADRNGVIFDPRTKKWESVGTELDLGWRGRACVVDGILFCYDFLGTIRGFDVEKNLWKELKGMGKELPRFLSGATMANVGGNLMVVWEMRSNENGIENRDDVEIWCAEIEVEKKEEEDLWGKIKWCNIVYKVPIGSSIAHCLAVTL
ncbi:F-box/kelch-repeat protein SKIP6 [Euphorbia lathyris]|uniref:F-box/kelch-repeat protein SKIP6 n=1 Tax=Euphorbia lathyris TaxID=212925 RepID=UPI0033135DE3